MNILTVDRPLSKRFSTSRAQRDVSRGSKGRAKRNYESQTKREALVLGCAPQRRPLSLTCALGTSPSSSETTSGASTPHRTLAALSTLPLCGRRVLITAPRQYAARLATYLVEAGARPVIVPAIAITETSNTAPLDAALLDLKSYSHVAFTSRNGIAAVLARLEVLHGGVEGALSAVLGSRVRLCALGNDGGALQDAGFPCHVLPAEPSTLVGR
ncbi:hypothetical protein CYMTET_20027 [Cymbomonas tetramitiformis]|uniref:Tetrapyrrole biosynthesis uroporphyrinogen III synthase domain-containing protein n=1 Tax=Cymbomonas tetramitiformis TaxID=36881 RepID=A0AAE0G670_9CHLO|nr:hypothetical protein CYMTET_20027 [Cymbomonas tetramitiformis]